MDRNSELAIYEEVMTAVRVTMCQFIYERAKSQRERIELCMVVGKSLVMSGGQFIGNSMDIDDADIGLAPARACIAEYDRMAEQ